MSAPEPLAFYCNLCKPIKFFTRREEQIIHLNYEHPGELEKLEERYLKALANAYVEHLLKESSKTA